MHLTEREVDLIGGECLRHIALAELNQVQEGEHMEVATALMKALRICTGGKELGGRACRKNSVFGTVRSG